MPLDVTYSAWALIFSAVFLHTIPDWTSVVFGILTVCGSIVAACDMKEILKEKWRLSQVAIGQVKKWLEQWNAADRVMELDLSSATVELAARALGCEEQRIAKTLSFEAEDGCILIVAAGDAKVNNGKFKARFGKKPRMLPPDQVEEKTGHGVGGVCPFGVKEGVQVYLDESLKRFETVFPACGSSNSAIEVTLPELEQFSEALGWVDVCRIPENEGQV